MLFSVSMKTQFFRFRVSAQNDRKWKPFGWKNFLFTIHEETSSIFTCCDILGCQFHGDEKRWLLESWHWGGFRYSRLICGMKHAQLSDWVQLEETAERLRETENKTKAWKHWILCLEVGSGYLVLAGRRLQKVLDSSHLAGFDCILDL